MKTVLGTQNLQTPLASAVVSVGNFDGLHRGHQQILRQARRLARERHTTLVAVTLEPHPLRLVAPQRAPATLTPLHEKLRCLQDAGVDLTWVLDSHPRLLGMSPRAFIEELIIPSLHPTHFVEGRSFGFGRRRAGDVQTLAEIGRQCGFQVLVVPPVQFTEETEAVRVSSSLIRQLIAQGRIAPANRCTRRRYALFGTVYAGKARGRSLGFPTANLNIDDQLVPGEGVYSGYAILTDQGNRSLPAAISVGHTPTFADTGLIVEAHLLDFDQNLIGSPLRLEFLRRIRDQKRFSGPEELAAQIERDVQQVRTQTAHDNPALGAPLDPEPI